MTIEDDENRGGMNWSTIAIVGALFMVGIGGALWVAPNFISEEQGDLVIIEAPKGGFKAKPVDAGGKKITNQDSAVMEMLGDLAPSNESVETLIPPSDEPELPAVTIAPEADETDVAVAPKATKPAKESAVKADKAETQSGQSGTATIVATPKPTEAANAAKAETPEPRASVKKKKIVVDGDEPAYMVQLAAFRDADIAAEQAGLLSTKHQSRLQGVTMGTMRIDTGENGIFWRIVSEPLPRAAADKVCASLKRAGQDCILRKFISPAQ